MATMTLEGSPLGEAGAAALRYFNDYYGIAYPEQKLDMVALPDFAAGAKENPGCITYREVASSPW